MSTTIAGDATEGPQRFFTVSQLAVRWQRSKRQIIRDIERGELIVHKFGKSVRVAPEDVLLYEAIRRKKKT
jgi:hypothetical protein